MYKVEFVCIANYCRSPVAEKILNSMGSDKVSSSSSGLSPMADMKMDKRSIAYLDSKSIEHTFHTPKKINTKKVEECDLLICFEIDILLRLQKKFPQFAKKIKIYNYNKPEIYVTDPFKIKDKTKYFKELDKIFILVEDWHQRIISNTNF